MSFKMSKLKRNYAAFVTVIAVLGVICVGLFAGNSFANENETNADYHITGKAQMYDGSPVSGATALVFLNGTGQIQGWSATSNPDGTFDVELTGISTGSYTGSFSVYTVDETPTLGFVQYSEKPFLVEGSKDVGTLTVYENQSVETYIDGERHGHWEICVSSLQPHWGQDQQVIARTNVISSLSKEGLVVNYSGGVDFPVQADSCTLTAVPVADPGYEVEYVTFKNVVSGEQELHVGDMIHGWSNALRAKFVPATCTVNIGDNIDKVMSNGQEIKDGDSVPYGTTLNIVPVMQEKCVSKISVNGAINSTGVATVDGDMNISARIADAVTISGKITADDTQVKNGNKDFSEILIQKAYATEVGVEGAKVSFTSTDGWNTSTLTDSMGDYVLEVEKGMPGTLTVSKDGYNTYSVELSASDLANDLTLSSSLISSKGNIAQTGDNLTYAVLVLLFILSGLLVVRPITKPSGLHVK